MPLIYNGTTIQKVIYNGTTLDKIVYNGVTIFESFNGVLYDGGNWVWNGFKPTCVKRAANHNCDGAIVYTNAGAQACSMGGSNCPWVSVSTNIPITIPGGYSKLNMSWYFTGTAYDSGYTINGWGGILTTPTCGDSSWLNKVSSNGWDQKVPQSGTWTWDVPAGGSYYIHFAAGHERPTDGASYSQFYATKIWLS